MSRRWLLLALAAAGAVQLAVPLGQIAGYERTLAQGTEWRFRVMPVDPADAFRGRYLALGYEVETAAVPVAGELEPDEWAYARLVEDADGFARLARFEAAPPGEGDYLRLRVGWTSPGPEGPETRVDLPFDRFYLPEGLALAAEERLRESVTSPGAPARAWAVVRVRDGRGVLEDLVIDGVSARRR